MRARQLFAASCIGSLCLGMLAFAVWSARPVVPALEASPTSPVAASFGATTSSGPALRSVADTDSDEVSNESVDAIEDQLNAIDRELKSLDMPSDADFEAVEDSLE